MVFVRANSRLHILCRHETHCTVPRGDSGVGLAPHCRRRHCRSGGHSTRLPAPETWVVVEDFERPKNRQITLNVVGRNPCRRHASFFCTLGAPLGHRRSPFVYVRACLPDATARWHVRKICHVICHAAGEGQEAPIIEEFVRGPQMKLQALKC